MKKIWLAFLLALLTVATVLCLASCGETDNPSTPDGSETEETVKVTLEETVNGTIDASKKGNKVPAGTKVVVTVTPEKGYTVETFTVNGEDKTADLVDNTYTVTVSEDVKFAVTFKLITYTATGVVTTSDGNLSGTNVKFESDKGTKVSAKVNQDGTYAVRGLLPGTYTVTVSHSYFADVTLRGVAVKKDTKMSTIAMTAYSQTTTSPVGSAASAGFIPVIGGYQSEGLSTVERGYYANFKGTTYLYQVDVGVIASFNSDSANTTLEVTGGIIAAQSATNAVCVLFNYNNAQYCLATNNATLSGTWTYGEWKDISSTAPWKQDLTVTVMRDGTTLKVYFNGGTTPVLTHDLTGTVGASEETAVGTFAGNSICRFTGMQAYAETDTLGDLLTAAEEAHATPEYEDANVIILAGQSNAVGISYTANLEKNAKEIYEKYKYGFENVYISYYCGSGYYSYRFTPVMFGQGYDPRWFGPEIGIAAYWAEHFPDQKLYIIKYAIGATNLYDQWRPSSPPISNLYKGFETRLCDTLDAMKKEMHLFPQVMAMCWMQGEGDADTTRYASYTAGLTELVDTVRNKLAAKSCKKYNEMLFVDATLHIYSDMFLKADKINEQKAAFADSSADNLLVNTQDLGLHTELEVEGNSAHFDSDSMFALGYAFGELACSNE